jgi:hypothetical protein
MYFFKTLINFNCCMTLLLVWLPVTNANGNTAIVHRQNRKVNRRTPWEPAPNHYAEVPVVYITG